MLLLPLAVGAGLAIGWLGVHEHVQGSRIAVDPRNFHKDDAERAGNEYLGPLQRRPVVLSDVTFNAYHYGPNRDRVNAVAAEIIEAFSPETTRRRRLEIFERYNVSCVIIDPRSPLWGRNVAATFGRGANLVDGDESVGRMAIQLGSPLANE